MQKESARVSAKENKNKKPPHSRPQEAAAYENLIQFILAAPLD